MPLWLDTVTRPLRIPRGRQEQHHRTSRAGNLVVGGCAVNRAFMTGRLRRRLCFFATWIWTCVVLAEHACTTCH